MGETRRPRLERVYLPARVFHHGGNVMQGQYDLIEVDRQRKMLEAIARKLRWLANGLEGGNGDAAGAAAFHRDLEEALLGLMPNTSEAVLSLVIPLDGALYRHDYERVKAEVVKDEAPTAEVREIWEHYQRAWGFSDSQRRLTPKRAKHIRARLKEFEPDVIKKAIDNHAKSEYHVTHGFDDILLVVRAEERVEFFAYKRDRRQ